MLSYINIDLLSEHLLSRATRAAEEDTDAEEGAPLYASTSSTSPLYASTSSTPPHTNLQPTPTGNAAVVRMH